MYDIKNKTRETTNTLKTVAGNVREFVRASSLVITATVSGVAAKTGEVHVHGVYAYIVAAAAAIIALEAAIAFWAHFKKS